jgi:hypothetical protein
VLFYRFHNIVEEKYNFVEALQATIKKWDNYCNAKKKIRLGKN